MGETLLLLDGVDELPDPTLKQAVRDQVQALLRRYPGNTCLVSSRIVGYDKEIRYDGIGFSHHQVARLTLGDIDAFVHSWYRARIDNEQERALHVGDLVRIVHDDDCRAIRDLAENPLLLTIICLVHRIDAVLPDERVVLYQKCTETLLNTWHAWKFKIEHQTSRNKVERRNRARMEAIAHWMHLAMGDQQGKRAVVPYEELLETLTEYIAEFEKPRYEDPRALAETFLRFVRERAGLLIEAGDRQYSFVHLTFQEYLTATFLRKSGEAGGVVVVWEAVQDKVAQSRWQEVLRLLIGSLDHSESQRFLLERIRGERSLEGGVRRALLLGGCLLDGVDAAEEMEEEILEELLYAATTTRDLNDLGELLQQLRTWLSRSPHGHALLQTIVESWAQSRGEQRLPPEIALVLGALDWGYQAIAANRKIPWNSEIQRRLFRHAMDPASSSGPVLPVQESTFVDIICRVMALTSLTSPKQNLSAVLLGAMVRPFQCQACYPSFADLLSVFLHTWRGPFEDYLRNAILWRYSGDLLFSQEPRSLDTDARSRRSAEMIILKALARDRDRAQTRDRALVQALDQARDRALVQALDQDQARARARARARALDRALDQALNRVPPSESLVKVASHFMQQVLGDSESRSELLGLCCELLGLVPSPPTAELRTCAY